MKRFISLVLGLCGALPALSQALVAPAYISVPHFQQCLSTTSQGSFRTWCLPASKPAPCPDASWSALQNAQVAAC
jgi:hypothetical protein